MQALERVKAGFGQIGNLLDAQALEPDPARKDWAAQQASIVRVTAALDTEVLGPLSAALADASDEDRRNIQLNTAHLVGEVAAMLHASGRSDSAASLVRRALVLATGDAELEGALSDLEGYTLLVRARWLFRKKQEGAADRAFKRAEKEARSDALKQAARNGYHAPRPITAAPPLFRINGCGVALYGERDVWPDGSHVATYCISVLFIPIFPLTAYRIIKRDHNSYSFFAKERLSSFARGYRYLLVACAALFFVVTGVAGYLESPARQARIAMDEAQAVEASGDREAAATRYAAIASDHGWRDAQLGEEAARATLRLTATDAAHADQLAARFRALPSLIQNGPAGEMYCAQLVAWAKESTDPRAALALLDLAGTSPIAASRVADAKAELQIALADALAGTWPVSALELYLDANAIPKASAVVARLTEHPSLLAAHRRTVERALAAADVPPTQRANSRVAGYASQAYGLLVDGAKDALDRAVAKQPVEGLGLAALQARTKRDPRDQEAAVALASLYRSRGDSKRALEILGALGEPGWLIPSAQLTLATLYLERGDLERSEAILDPYLSSSLPRFAVARQQYTSAVKAFREALVNQAKFGKLPLEIEQKLTGASDDEQGKIFFDWVNEKEAQDASLLALRTEYEAHADVVPASVTLGMVKLRRAGGSSGEERARLLKRAEEVFLGIRAEAEGLPTYHLGLGQVYHRLGRNEDGDRELAGVLAMNDPQLAQEVASIYRELGLVKQAREVAQTVFDGGDAQTRDQAAVMLSMLAPNLDEELAWLNKVSGKDEYLEANRAELDGRVLYRDGKYREAERMFERAAAIYQKQAAHNSVSANNAALAQQRQYLCSGDPRLLKQAVKGLETALRLEPDNALIIGNLAALYQYQGETELAGRWIDAAILHLDSGQAGALVEMLAQSRLRADVLDLVRESASLARSVELSRQEQVLSPERIDAYFRELGRATLLEDEAMLTDLEKRVANVVRVDTTQAEEAMRSYQSGDQTTQLLAGLDSDLARLEAALAIAEAKHHAPTIAAIHALRGDELARRSAISGEADDARRGVAELEAAEAAWDGVRVRGDRAALLLSLAVLEAKKSSPALEAAWAKESRELGMSLMTLQAIESGPSEIVAALRAQPALAQSVAATKTLEDRELTIGSWILARIAGDAELEQRAQIPLKRAMLRRQTELGMKLAPTMRAGMLTKAIYDRAD